MTFVDDFELIHRMALALGIGLLFGIERGWKTRSQHGGKRTAGLRTFVLIGLLGGVCGLLGRISGDIVLGLTFAAFTGLVVVAYLQSLKSSTSPDLGITTEVAALLTFALAALVVRGDMLIPVVIAVVAVAFLHGKRGLHGWLGQIRRLEFAAALQLLVITLVLLPILPDRGFGPGQVLNPFEIWLMVVLISALSFTGYVACKLVGARFGLLVVGLLGGLASSTALTLSFSRLARQTPELGGALAGGIAIANTVMLARVLVLVAIFNTGLLAHVALPVAVMAVVSLVGAAVLAAISKKTANHEATVRDPADLATALTFGALLALVLLAAYLVHTWLGPEAVYGVALVSGLVDVDALTLSMSELADASTLTMPTAAGAIVIATLANLIAKGGIVAVVGRGEAATKTAIVFALVIVSGLVAWLAV